MGLSGTGYQWTVSPCSCRANAIEAGDISPGCPSTCWFWLIAAGVGLVSFFAPVKGGRQ